VLREEARSKISDLLLTTFPEDMTGVSHTTEVNRFPGVTSPFWVPRGLNGHAEVVAFSDLIIDESILVDKSRSIN